MEEQLRFESLASTYGDGKVASDLRRLSNRFKLFSAMLFVSQIISFSLFIVLILLNGGGSRRYKVDEQAYSGVLIFGGSEDSEDVFEVAFKPRSEEDAASLEFCSITSALPGKDLFGAVGVNFFNEEEKKDEISFCGGSKNSDCFALKRDEEHFFHWQRSNAEGSGGLGIGLALQYAAAVRLSADLWWITGGRNASKVPSDETKLLHRKLGLAEGPKMPEAKYGHCAVDVTAAFSGDSGVNYKYLMLVGGRPLSTSVYLGRWENSVERSLSWFRQADIGAAREGAACALLKNSMNEYEVVVAGGGKDLTSSEVFGFSSMGWKRGAEMMVSFHHGLTVKWAPSLMIVFGGKTSNDSTSNQVYGYNHLTEKWSHSRSKMRRARAYFTGVPLERAREFC